MIIAWNMLCISLNKFPTILLGTASAYQDSDKVPVSSVVEIVSSHMSIIIASHGTPLRYLAALEVGGSGVGD